MEKLIFHYLQLWKTAGTEFKKTYDHCFASLGACEKRDFKYMHLEMQLQVETSLWILNAGELHFERIQVLQ